MASAHVETLDALLQYIQEARLLAAKEEYHKLIDCTNQTEDVSTDLSQVTEKLERYDPVIKQALLRAEEALVALECSDVDDSWTFGMALFGVTTHYKTNADDGCIIVRLEGLLEEFPLFEQTAVIHEIDLFTEWVPFCNAAKKITKTGHADIIAYLSVYFPGIGRDTLMRAFAVDCLEEHNKIALIGSSIPCWPPEDEFDAVASAQLRELCCKASTDPLLCNAEPESVPWVQSGWFHDKFHIKEFKAFVEVMSPTSAKTVFVACVDPRIALPQSLINFIIQKLAGVFLYLFQRQAQKLIADPSCLHGQRIRANPSFYVDWFLPKLRHYCNVRGWAQPVIASLGPAGTPQALTPAAEMNSEGDVAIAPEECDVRTVAEFES